MTREREVTVHSRRYIVDSATRPRIAPDDAPSGHDAATQHSELLDRSEPVGGAARVIPTHVSVDRRDCPAPPQNEADEEVPWNEKQVVTHCVTTALRTH